MDDTLTLHHINFLVRDLETNCVYLSNLLNLQPVKEPLSKRNVMTARFKLDNCWIVLVQPLSEEGEVARILAQRGEGLFLLSLGCEDLDKQLSRLEKLAISADDKGKRAGLLDWSVVDLNHPPGLGPVLQLCQSLNRHSSTS